MFRNKLVAVLSAMILLFGSTMAAPEEVRRARVLPYAPTTRKVADEGRERAGSGALKKREGGGVCVIAAANLPGHHGARREFGELRLLVCVCVPTAPPRTRAHPTQCLLSFVLIRPYSLIYGPSARS